SRTPVERSRVTRIEIERLVEIVKCQVVLVQSHFTDSAISPCPRTARIQPEGIRKVLNGLCRLASHLVGIPAVVERLNHLRSVLQHGREAVDSRPIVPCLHLLEASLERSAIHLL